MNVEYGCYQDFKQSVCYFRDNWNRYRKDPEDSDIGLRDAFRRMCVQLYSWALDLYQTLPNYVRHRGVICYSFICLADRIGQLLWTNRPDCVLISTDMHLRALKNATPAMQELEGETKDFIDTKFSLMSIFDGVQCQQMVKGITPHTAIESE